MKRKTRTVTVNGKRYVWWNGFINYTTSLFLSPEGDKTSTISVDFTDKCSDNEWNMSVVIKKDGTERTVKIVEPAMSGLLLPYLQEQETFILRKNIVMDGIELLKKMGYEVIEIEKGFCW
ncbi:MAG: hypothetical protein NC177_10455 [Ruminococcus flavefaciens]|nr:hypothetical protein [Ruminococcus flavefaciens]